MTYFRLLLYFLKEGAIGILRHKTLHIFAIFIVSLSLFILGFSRYITFNINSVLTLWESSLEVRVIIKEGTPTQEIEKIVDFLLKQNFVESAKIITPQEALRLLEKISPSIKSVPSRENENLLPYSIAVKLKKPYSQQTIQNFINETKKQKEIEEVVFDWQWLEKLKTYSKFLAFLGWLLFVALGVSSLFTVTAITRIIALSRKEEIAILYSLGATPSAIRGPFITSGTIVGFLSSFLSIIFLLLVHISLRRFVSDAFILNLISKEFLTFSDQSILIIVGAIMGGAGGFLSLVSLHDWQFVHYN
ncbi:MAG: permease-like cell division protein FtsX [Acidobacteria bacterium]|nr:permease-like cell division protein FtsX [Acidobacteriota bacterium]